MTPANEPSLGERIEAVIQRMRFPTNQGSNQDWADALVPIAADVRRMEEQVEAFKKWNRRMWEEANPEAARNQARALEDK